MNVSGRATKVTRAVTAAGASLLALFAVSCNDGSDDDDSSNDDIVYGEPGHCTFDDLTPPAVAISSKYDGRQAFPIWYHGVSATFYEWNMPSTYSTIYQEGECRYLKLSYGHCEPPCTGEFQVCTTDDTCEPYPVGLPAGDLIVDVAGDSTTLTFAEYANSYYGEIPFFDSGTPVTLTTTGETVEGFVYETSGIDYFDNTAAQGITISGDEDHVFTWQSNGSPEDCVYLKIYSANEAHGAPINDIIECRSPNDGMLVISHSLLEQYPLWEHRDPYLTGRDWPASEIGVYRPESIEIGGLTFEINIQSGIAFLMNE